MGNLEANEPPGPSHLVQPYLGHLEVEHRSLQARQCLLLEAMSLQEPIATRRLALTSFSGAIAFLKASVPLAESVNSSHFASLARTAPLTAIANLIAVPSMALTFLPPAAPSLRAY